MNISGEGIALIKQFEGFSPIIYICPGGYPTIGYGHKIRQGEEFKDAINENIADKILKDDINQSVESVGRLVTVTLSQGQIDALVSLVYNIGAHAFEKSTLLKKLNAGNYSQATGEFSRWIYSKNKKIEGLVRRRAAESLLFCRKT